MRKRLDDLTKNSAMLFIILMASSAINYLFQIVMGKLLGPAEYGTINSLLSLVNIVSVPTGLLSVLASKYSTHFLSLGRPGDAVTWNYSLFKISFWLALATLVVGTALSSPVANMLQLDNVWLVVLCFAVVTICYLSPVLMGTLQGTKRFASYGLVNVVSSAAKLLFSVVFIYLGLRVSGAVLAVALSAVCMFLFEYGILRNFLRTPREKHLSIERQEIRRYVISAFAIQLGLALLSNGDILLVKAFSTNAVDVGLYASGMVIGRIPLYLVTAIVAVLFPLVAERAAKQQSTIGLFYKATVYSALSAIAFSLFLIFLGEPVVRLMFGANYAAAAPLFLPICCLTLTVAMLTVEIQYFLALGKTKTLTISLLVGFAAVWFVVNFWHSTIPQMLYGMSSVLAAVFCFNFLCAIRLDRTPVPM